MRLKIEELEVFFPYDFVYREQHEYMLELKRALDAQGDALLEMPTGTGKTVSLLSLITSYQFAHPEAGKLIYCTRTVPEMEKTVEEVKRVLAYRARVLAEEAGLDGAAAAAAVVGPESDTLCVCLSTRKNLCIHPEVSAADGRAAADAGCRALTASWVRERAREPGAPPTPACDFFEGWAAASAEADVRGVYDLKDLRELGQAKGWCPYFFARQVIAQAQIVVYSYQ
jgi:DNA excision repair protein ERCC-2